MLSCNPSKTEIIHFSSRFSKYVSISNVDIGQHTVNTSKEARNLGVVFDQHLSMSNHVNNICCSASIALRHIGRIRKYLDNSSTERLIHAFISSKLDYCNSVLYGLPSKELDKLQHIQNAAARLVSRTKKREHITLVLFNLHWLPAQYRIMFKMLLF